MLANKDGCIISEICDQYEKVSKLIVERGFRVDNFYKIPTKSIVERAIKLLGNETFNIKYNMVQIKLDLQKNFVNLTKKNQKNKRKKLF